METETTTTTAPVHHETYSQQANAHQPWTAHCHQCGWSATGTQGETFAAREAHRSEHAALVAAYWSTH